MATVSYQAWPVGQTFPAWEIPLATDAGKEDLTGVNVSDITLVFRPNSRAGNDSVGTGTITIKSVYPGVLLYKPSTADVASAFTGQIYIKITMPPSHSTADEVVYDAITFNITA